jgi:hypothetical protein
VGVILYVIDCLDALITILRNVVPFFPVVSLILSLFGCFKLIPSVLSI